MGQPQSLSIAAPCGEHRQHPVTPPSGVATGTVVGPRLVRQYTMIAAQLSLSESVARLLFKSRFANHFF